MPIKPFDDEFAKLVTTLRQIDDTAHRRALCGRLLSAIDELPDRRRAMILRFYGLSQFKKVGPEPKIILAERFNIGTKQLVIQLQWALYQLHNNPQVAALYKLQELPEYVAKKPGQRKPLKLPAVEWDLIPASMRMTVEDLERCGGARRPDWLQRQQARLLAPETSKTCCRFGVQFGNSWQKYAPCSFQPAEGERFCWRHGGRKTHEAEAARKLEAEILRQERLAEHQLWHDEGVALGAELQRRLIDRLHERALADGH